jgi:hypothetical protein
MAIFNPTCEKQLLHLHLPTIYQTYLPGLKPGRPQARLAVHLGIPILIPLLRHIAGFPRIDCTVKPLQGYPASLIENEISESNG